MDDIAAAEKYLKEHAKFELPVLDMDTEKTLDEVRQEILTLEKEFVFEQIKQQFVDDLGALASPEAMREFATNSKLELEQGELMMLAKEKEFIAAFQAREELSKKLEDILIELEARRETLIKRVEETKYVVEQNEKMRQDWKTLQRLNTQKKTVLELTFKLKIPKDANYAEMLDEQMQGIIKDTERERALEDTALELSAEVKRAELAVEELQQEAARRAEDPQLIDRINKYQQLVDMSKWYQNMTNVMQTISGMQVVKCEGSTMIVKISDYTIDLKIDAKEGVLEDAKISPSDIDISDVIEVAVEENDLSLLLMETRSRVHNFQKLIEDISTLQQKGIMCAYRQDNCVQITLMNTLYQVQASTEYGRNHEWLKLCSMSPSDPKLISVVNKELQCTTLQTLVDRLLEYQE
ncbi:hypothetical protein THRCLA_09818 [Thraustotheca clavata]|uniref:Uncharacterized protein n=1 Tax=Thraustotheca clavata TaxID=74557 RepID=A0A1V9YUB9_9STRA|nr:hypothetical protein THRCLA_09818 [Thraustotheca clavata]